MKNGVLLLVVCSFLVFFTAVIVRADWQIVYSDTLVNEMRKQGLQCPKRHGSWRTREEAEAARRQEGLATGNYHMFMTYESWVEGFDDPAPKISVPRKDGEVHRDKRYQDEQKRLIQEEEERRAKEQKERELARQREFERGKSDLLKTLKDAGGKQELGLKPAAKEKQIETLQTWKQLNNRVYWALAAAEEALNGAYEKASEYSKWSTQAKSGITSGYPEVDIPIPDVPAPAEANTQVKLYNLLVEETNKLIPVFQRTDKKIVDLTKLKKITEERIAQKRKEIEELEKKPPAPLKEEEEKKGRALEEAKALLKSVMKVDKEISDELDGAISERANAEYKLNVIDQAYTTVQKEPGRAEEFLKVLETSR